MMSWRRRSPVPDNYFDEEEFQARFDKGVLRRILGLTKPHLKWVIGFLITIAIVAVMDSFFTYLSKRIIDDGILAHTNHYLSLKMKEIESESDELIHTRVRYMRALRLLKQNKKHSIKTLQTILQDHVNYPDSICNHSIFDLDPLDREKTIVSMIMDITTHQMVVAWGNPCKNNYQHFTIDI